MGYLIAVAVIFIGEFFIKTIVELWGSKEKRTPFLKDKLYLTKYHNKGAFLNMLESKEQLLHILSAGLTIACGMLFLLTLTRRGNTVLKTGLTFLLGGAFSNTYDRLKRKYVVDYFGFESKNEKIRNIVFNLSDFFIMVGALLTAMGLSSHRK